MSKNICISRGNSKLGNVLNISLPPGAACRPGIPCFNEGCYARKAYRLYPNVKAAWDKNYKFWLENPVEYFKEIAEACIGEPFFRWHVAGDVPDQSYLDYMVDIARQLPDTRFLCFTKKYDLDFKWIPKNLQIVLSTWPGLELPENKGLPWAWLSEDWRRPLDDLYLVCPGDCSACGNKCWDLVSAEIPVVFPKH